MSYITEFRHEVALGHFAKSLNVIKVCVWGGRGGGGGEVEINKLNQGIQTMC